MPKLWTASQEQSCAASTSLHLPAVHRALTRLISVAAGPVDKRIGRVLTYENLHWRTGGGNPVRERFCRGAHAIKIMTSGGVISLIYPIRAPQFSEEEIAP